MEHLVYRQLSAAGFHCQPAEVALEPREDRWLVRLPEQRLAWFAASDEGLESLRTERKDPETIYSELHGNTDVAARLGASRGNAGGRPLVW
jgi:hypothetical protein